MSVTNSAAAPLPLPSLDLTVPPGTKPADAKSMITDAVNKLVPLEAHVAVVAIATKDSAGTTSFRFASAQRVGEHLQFHEDLNFAHGSTGQAWAGEVGIVGVW